MTLHKDLYPHWMRACARGKLVEMENMVNGGPWLDLTSETPKTSCLILASMNGHKELCRRLLAHRPHLDARNDNGQTPLIGAAIEGHQEIVQMLLQAGADIRAVDNDARSALFYAVRDGNLGLVKLLLPHATPELVNQATRFGETCVVAACHSVNPEMMELMLAHGGNPNQYNEEEKERVMRTAILLDNGPVVGVLARHGARLGHMHNGESYLHTAVRQRCEETVKALLDAGANPNRQSRQKKTAAEIAQEVGFSGYHKVLAEHQHDHMQATTQAAEGLRRVRL